MDERIYVILNHLTITVRFRITRRPLQSLKSLDLVVSIRIVLVNWLSNSSDKW